MEWISVRDFSSAILTIIKACCIEIVLVQAFNDLTALERLTNPRSCVAIRLRFLIPATCRLRSPPRVMRILPTVNCWHLAVPIDPYLYADHVCSQPVSISEAKALDWLDTVIEQGRTELKPSTLSIANSRHGNVVQDHVLGDAGLAGRAETIKGMPDEPTRPRGPHQPNECRIWRKALRTPSV
jgi:hypothetical protein